MSLSAIFMVSMSIRLHATVDGHPRNDAITNQKQLEPDLHELPMLRRWYGEASMPPRTRARHAQGVSTLLTVHPASEEAFAQCNANAVKGEHSGHKPNGVASRTRE